MSAAHTPGDWFADWGDGVTGPRASFGAYLAGERNPGFLRIPIRVGNTPVAWVIASADMLDGREEADARLIASAPCLLAALTELVDHCERLRDPAREVHAARAAIARATGEQS